MLTPKDKQDARIALLRYYSFQCVAHGAYLVAIAVGLFSLVQLTPSILEFAASVTLLPVPSEIVTSILFSLILSGFVVAIAYVIGRTFFWGHLATSILHVKPKEESEVERESDKTTITFLQQLHLACLDYVKEKHKWSAQFYTLRRNGLALIWFDLFVVFLIVSLILSYVGEYLPA